MSSDVHGEMRQLSDAVSRMIGRLRSTFDPVNTELGLSSMEMTVLNAVVEASAPPTVPQIGRRLGHPRQVIQRATNLLLERGLIATEQNPNHKRAVLLTATAAGAAMKARADALAAAISTALMEAVDLEMVGQATELLHQIRRQIDAHARTAVA